jgi:hypothetical protein
VISLLKKKTPLEPLSPYHDFDEGPTIEVSIEGWEVDEEKLGDAFTTFATAVLGYEVRVTMYRRSLDDEDAVRKV